MDSSITSGVVTSSNTVVGTIVDDRLLVSGLDWAVIVVADVKTKNLWVDVLVSPKEKSTKDWLGKDIEDTVEDCLGVWSNDVSSLRQSPSDGVEEPEEDGPATADDVGALHVGTERTCVLDTDVDNVVGDEEERDHGEGEVTPLV